MFIKESKVFALVNTILEVAIVFQIGEPIALLANGKTGVSVVINIDKGTVVHYPAGSNDSLWKYSQSSLVDYLQKLGSLTNVNNWKNGQSFKIKSVTKEVKNVIVSIIGILEFQIAKIAKTNLDAVIPLISVIINSLLDSKGVLELLLVKLDTSLTIIVGGLSKIVNLVAGLKVVGNKLNGGIQALLKNDINVSLLLGENSGLSSLLNLLLQVGVKVDLTKILGNLLNPVDLLEIAVTLDGGIYYGVSGLTAVIHNVQLYAAKKISLEALIDILIQVQAVNDHVKINKDVLNNLLNLFFSVSKSQVSQFNTGSSWSSLNKFFQDIKDDKLVINGINVSAIINILISTSGNVSLANVVKILLNLKPLVALNKIIATLYFRLIYFVISGQGLIFIEALLPDITISINLSSGTNIITQILANVNVLQIVSYLLRLDIVGAITHLPVLGPILKALDEIIKAVGIAAEVTVTSALKAVGSILDDLKNIILFGLGRGGKAPSDAGIAGLSILGGGISVSINTSWKSSSTWSSSSSSSGSEGTTVATSSSVGGSQGGSGSHSGGSSIGGSSSSSGGSSSGGSGSHSGGTSVGGGASSSGGNSVGGSGSHSGGSSVGGDASSSGGSSSGGSGSHSGGISIGGSASSDGGHSKGGSASHSGGISIGGSSSSSGGGKGSWSLGNLLGGGGGNSKETTSSHSWSLF